MRKLLSTFMTIAILLGFSACGAGAVEDQPKTTQNPQSDAAQTAACYGFVFQDTELVPGNCLAAEKLPMPQYTYRQTNTIWGGEDTFYNFVDIEVIVYNNGASSVIRSIVVISPNLKTPEGLSLGDSTEQVIKLYGNNYVEDGDQWLFSVENTCLAVLIQDGLVAGIEYHLTGL